MENEYSDQDILPLASEIVSAYASRNQMSQADLPDLIKSVYATLRSLDGGQTEETALMEEPTVEAQKPPAVPIDQSVRNDAIVCLECGKSFKTLKRHLNSEHGFAPAEYRDRWQLSKDYPLVAPDYSKTRAATAKKIGLGRKPGARPAKK
ncbi:MucR family transcriptional regulator [Anianabacter salinae]|uniref:MucR family transcriptional regulator n=1 Tax=Anianabacter salinae TaxID=2851023 RepID=UPI00225E2AF0|nr:MucR family transcriptional regulator [Anianabacter salinae]MBV0911124.1 MucR family transcriptional regulator [Anianabacter salinae]